MTVNKYTTDFSQERHGSYARSFKIEDIGKYYRHINRYILDQNLSPTDQDDVELFKDLLFESRFGRVHIAYSEWLVHYAGKKKSRVNLVDRYIAYISEVSSLFYEDFVGALIKYGNINFVEYLMATASLETRLVLVKTLAQHFPKMMRQIPKLKTYLIFS